MASVLGSLVAAQSPCPVCGHAEATLVALKDRHSNPLRTLGCSLCGLTRTGPTPTAKELDNFYAKEYRASYKGVLTPRPPASPGTSTARCGPQFGRVALCTATKRSGCFGH